jgi:crossover junction endodeoxyribonuclease RuvC
VQGELEELFRRLRPSVVAVESAFHARNARSALRLGEARGIVLAAAARAGLAVAEVAPAAAKKAVIGHGAASKDQVASMVATILGTAPFGVARDATDALAVALAHVKRMARAALTTRVRRGAPTTRPAALASPGSARLQPGTHRRTD